LCPASLEAGHIKGMQKKELETYANLQRSLVNRVKVTKNVQRLVGEERNQ